MSASIVDIPLSMLEEDPENRRRAYNGIGLMADSIALAGLLENLCVVPKIGDDGKFVVKAGNRRRRAMMLLVERGEMSAEHPVPCKILEGDGEMESGVENIGREDLRPWEIGEHYLRLSEKGMHQKQIGDAHAKSQQHVSLCLRIARDLSPKVIERVSRLVGVGPNYVELSRIAELKDPDTLGPDTDKQLVALDALLGEKRVRVHKNLSRTRRLTLHMASRVELLQTQHVPPHAAPYVNAVIDFLRGSDEELALPEAPTHEW